MDTEIITIEEVEDTTKFLHIVEDYQGSSAFKRILQIIQIHGLKRSVEAKESCITILKNEEYKDADWEDEFKEISRIKDAEYNYNSEGLWTPFKNTLRFDFFSTKLNIKEWKNFKKLGKEYLGYCVLRPPYRENRQRKVLKAVIKPLVSKRVFVESVRPLNTEIKIKLNNNIIKGTLKIEGFPFQQQDGYIGRCAHASISISNWYMHPEQGLRKLSKFLESYKKHHFQLPSFYRDKKLRGGLNYTQIVEITKEFSNPLVYIYPMSEKWKIIAKRPERAIYWYIESGLPVIIGELSIPHSIVAIGHDSNPDRWWELAKTSYYEIPPSYHSSADWVENFVIQDDNFGPYLQFPVRQLEWILKEKKEKIVIIPLLPKMDESGFLKTKNLFSTLKELKSQLKKEGGKYKGTRYVRAENVEACSHSILEGEVPRIAKKRRIQFFEEESKDTFKLFLQHFDKKDLVYRVYLINKGNFMTSLSERGMDKKYIKLKNKISSLTEYYKKKLEELPDLFWVNEISIPELYCHQNQYLGEILISPLQFEYETKEKQEEALIPFFIMHIPGILYDYQTFNKFLIMPIMGDNPYRILTGNLRSLKNV